MLWDKNTTRAERLIQFLIENPDITGNEIKEKLIKSCPDSLSILEMPLREILDLRLVDILNLVEKIQ